MKTTTPTPKNRHHVWLLIKRFTTYYSAHRGLFLLDISCAIVISIINLAVPFLSRYMLNDLLAQKTFQQFFSLP